MTSNYKPPILRSWLNHLFGRITPMCYTAYWDQFRAKGPRISYRSTWKRAEDEPQKGVDIFGRVPLECGDHFEADQPIEVHGFVEPGQHIATATLEYTIPGKLPLTIDHPDINTTEVGILCSEDARGKIQIISKRRFERLTDIATGETVYQAFRPEILVKIPQMVGPKIIVEKLSDVTHITRKLTAGALTIVQPVITSVGVSALTANFVYCTDVQMVATNLEGVIANIAPARTHAYITKESFDEYVCRVQAQSGKTSV